MFSNGELSYFGKLPCTSDYLVDLRGQLFILNNHHVVFDCEHLWIINGIK